MKKESIFIHIPKTGGTTINCAMNNTKWQTNPDFNYRHINHETKRSNSKDIFNPSNYEKYSEYNIFMLLRHPVDRIISEYFFIKDRKEFLSLLKPYPKSLKQYIENRQTQNYMIGFLLGKQIYDTSFVDSDDFEIVKNAILNLPIHVGIFEKYEESMSYFESVIDIKWPKKMDVKRITLNRPQISEVPENIKDLIINNNQLDIKLYDFCLSIFEEKSKNIKIKSINFNANKYDYVLKYTERFCLLELDLKSKEFINAHKEFFDDLNIFLHKKLKIKDGLTYNKLWNSSFVLALNEQFKNTSLANDINFLQKEQDPLTLTKNIAKIIDDNLLIKDVKRKNLYLKKLTFNENMVKKPSIFRIF